MSSRPAATYDGVDERRWWILAVLCVGLLVLVIDNSILNVALPTIVRELDASNSQLQWMVDAYTIVLAGLLLTAGVAGDRFGRRRALQVGFAVFGAGSLAAALADTADVVIAARAVMGVGAALIMPATLAIITTVFPPAERGRAIGVWGATAGVAVVLGPVSGGFLLEHFYWGAIFLVNLPIVVMGLVAGVVLIPESRDPAAGRIDAVGAALSVVGLSALVYAVIEAPVRGWSSPETVVALAVAVAALAAFVAWERRGDSPMLDLALFRRPRFTAATLAVTITFFVMFGSFFVMTQYLQFVLGYEPLETGLRLLPYAAPILLVSPLSPRIAERIGTKATVAAGMSLIAAGLLATQALEPGSPYGAVAWRLAVLATGIGLTMAPSTESIMGSLPPGKAGAGAAVSTTSRMAGGAFGVAIVGSVYASGYRSGVAERLAGTPVPGGVAQAARESVGLGITAAERVGGAAGDALTATVHAAFVEGMHTALAVAAAVAIAGALAVLAWLPARQAHVHDRPGAAPADQPAA
ncbi:MAG TPA: MFS transporter [Acidimicrobiales bacterium]